MKQQCLLLLCFVLIANGQRVAIRRKLPKKIKSTSKPRITTPSEDLNGNLHPDLTGQIASRQGCAPPEVLVNGSVVPDSSNHDFSTIQEVQFVGLVGRRDQKRTCKIKCMNGVWVGPICTVDEGGKGRVQRIYRRCTIRLLDAELMAVTDQGRALSSDAEESLPHDSEIHLRCVEPGLYKFVGNDTLICDDGSWTSDVPYCVATTMHRNFSLQAPPTILYHVVSGDAGLTEDGSIVVFPGTIINLDCLYQRQYGNPTWAWTPTHSRQYPRAWAISAEDKSSKYRLSIYYAKDHDSGTYTCTTPQDISNEVNIVVKDVHCPAIRSVDHNRVMAVEGNRMHSKARFACMEGYELEGHEEITCQASGQWSDEAPHCEVVKCPALPENPHLVGSTQNRTYGTRVVFSCRTGFKLLGPPYLNCLKTGNWSDVIPSCSPITCKPPVVPLNGRVLDTGRYLAGDFVQYTCNAGHVVVGEPVAICNDHGVWSQPPPTCKAACEFPGEPSNGQVIPTKFHYDIGEVVAVGCHPGYRVLGYQSLRCTSSSHWSSPLPHCRRYLQT